MKIHLHDRLAAMRHFAMRHRLTLATWKYLSRWKKNMMAELEKVHVGNGIEPSCLVQNIGGTVHALKVFEGKRIDPDEMNYLARRLDSFDQNELLQFQGAIARDGLHTMKDLINLTFNVSNYAVVSDFSNLEKAGSWIYFAHHGGVANESDVKKTDLRRWPLRF